jgi:putative endonuclease
MKRGFTYIVMNANRTLMYVGVTSNIEQRATEHKTGVGSLFRCKYAIKYLVYYEEYDISESIKREKNLKNWHREWKLNLIKSINPERAEIIFH